MRKYQAVLFGICVFAVSVFANDTENKNPISYDSFVNPNWEKWAERSYNYGFDKNIVPVPLYFDSIATDATIMVRGNNNHKKRWGLHVFEAYAQDDKSRITMILNKHIEEGLPVAELYYYASAYGQGTNAYNWFRIGSDVPFHSYMFGRDNAIFYGAVEMRNVFTLDSIGKDDLLDEMPPRKQWKKEAEEKFPTESFKTKKEASRAQIGVMYQYETKVQKKKELDNAKDGAMYYNKDIGAVVVKIKGKWHKVLTEPIE